MGSTQLNVNACSFRWNKFDLCIWQTGKRFGAEKGLSNFVGRSICLASVLYGVKNV